MSKTYLAITLGREACKRGYGIRVKPSIGTLRAVR